VRNAASGYDHEAAVGGGPWELLTIKGSLTNDAVIEWLQSEFGIEIKPAPTRRVIVAAYDYCNEQGELLFQVCRFEPKDFRQRRPDGKGGWIWQVQGTRQVPYRLPELIATPSECIVYTVEGEKDVDRLASLGFVATCNAGGAAKRRADGKPGKPKWRPELSAFFQGRDVVIVPDNDDAGGDHAHAVAANLAPVAARVRILELPGLPPKGDVSDWLDAGGGRDELDRLAGEAPLCKSVTQSTGDARIGVVDADPEIARLAKLSRPNYERERETAAKRLGCRVSILDDLVDAKRGNGIGSIGQGRALNLPELLPWPRSVDCAMLLGRLARAIQRHVVLNPHEAERVALWVLAAHALDAWTIFPRLFVTAPEKQCGKSTLLDVLSRLVPRPLMASGITAPALFRTIEAARPTLLLDEADAYARENEELRAVLDAGHRRDGAVIRLVGDNHEPRQFSAWAPIALAAIGHLPGTIEDRSITVRLRRRRPDEPIQSFRFGRTWRLEVLARMAVRWAADHMAVLATTDPAMPAGIYNRAADNWRPLLAVADLAGGGWPAGARRAAVQLSDQDDDGESARVLLLGDLRELFKGERSGVLFTKEILAALAKDETRPWPEWKHGKPITDRQLASLLKPFNVRPKSVRRGVDTDKGYRRDWFDDAFSRYLSAFQSVTPLQASASVAFGALRTVTIAPGVTDEDQSNASVSAGCDAVTDRKPVSSDEEATWTG
jgi:putative DNA primase/helicase